MIRSLLIQTLFFCMCISSNLSAHEFEYTGTISLNNGLSGNGNWSSGPTTLSWDIFHPDGSVCYTDYVYTFEHPATDTFEFFLEVGTNLQFDSIYEVSSTLPNYEIGWFDSSDHPGLPGEIYGFRFWGDSGSTTETISFRADFFPFWSDFFSSGLDSMDYAWNEGFPDPNPSSPAANGSLVGHILAPGGFQVIPEPSGYPSLLIMAALVFVPARHRRA